MSGFKNFQRKLDGLPPVDKTQRLGLEFVSSPFEPLEWSDYDDEDDDFDPDMDFEVGWDEDAELYFVQEPDNQLTGSNQTSGQQGPV